MRDRHKELQEKWDSKSIKKKWSKTLENSKPVLIKRGEIPTPTPTRTNRKLDVIIISVNYNDMLILTLKHNRNIFDNITVITSTDDILCQKICEKLEIKYFTTDVMYSEDESFNKGKAINYGISTLENPDYILLLDADMIVSEEINLNELDEKKLYTSNRWICQSYVHFSNWRKGESEIENVGKHESDKGLGFFQLFNYSNECLDKSKPFPESSKNASWSDLLFRDKFNSRQTINNNLIHLGEAYKNWDGRISKRFLTDDDFDYELETIKRKARKNTSLLNILNELSFNTNKVDYDFDFLDKENKQFIIHVASVFKTKDTNSIRRNEFAQETWKKFYESGDVIPAMYYSNDLPKIKDIFDWGYKFCKNDDDIILYTNSDICLTNDAYKKILESCNEWQCTFSFRKDFDKLEETKTSIEVSKSLFSDGSDTPKGADVFAVTKRWWSEWRDYLPDDQTIGRPTWDWVFRITMGVSLEGNITFRKKFEDQGSVCETPNISYHETHESFWNKSINLLESSNLWNTKIAYNWMSEKSDNIKFTGKEYFEKTYGEYIK